MGVFWKRGKDGERKREKGDRPAGVRELPCIYLFVITATNVIMYVQKLITLPYLHTYASSITLTLLIYISVSKKILLKIML